EVACGFGDVLVFIFGFVLAGRTRRPVGHDRLVRARPTHFPLIEHLKGRFARAVARCPVDCGHARIPGGRLGAASDRNSAAMSIAAAAASRPLLSGPSPARSSACSRVSVVSTPNVIGMPVSPAAAVMPCAAARAMYSK